jgi:AcrR family transcriptional regulator
LDKQVPVTRHTRRRLETRARLLRAALELMAHKGIEATTIQEITDAADVGFGSFYNHFESKEAILEAMMAEMVDSWSDVLDGIAAQKADPAEALAASVRYTLRKAAKETTWGWFQYRAGPWMLHSPHGLGGRLAQRVQRGVNAGRFGAEDPQMEAIAVGGTVLAAISAVLHGEIKKDAPERVATVCLTLLGLPAKEAAEIARRPLPKLKL